MIAETSDLTITSTVDSIYQDVPSEATDFKDIEMTLAIIKPEAYKHALTIEKIITNEGFKVIQKRIVHLTPEQSSDFYFDSYGQLGFPKMVLSLCDGPIVAMTLARVNAIKQWNALLGPENIEEAKTLYPSCLRSHFGDLARKRNGLHGSESLDRAEKEIHFFFPKFIMQPIRTQQERVDYLNETLNPTLLKGLVELCKSKPADPILWLADWLLENNPYQPKMHPDLQQIPT